METHNMRYVPVTPESGWEVELLHRRVKYRFVINHSEAELWHYAKLQISKTNGDFFYVSGVGRVYLRDMVYQGLKGGADCEG